MTSALVETLTNIRQSRGSLTPEILVEEARDPAHPLHTRFEWDDTIAAQKYRIVQAEKILRVVAKPEPGAATELRAFVAVKKEHSRAEYVPTREALEDPFTAKLLLQQMEREAKAFRARYRHMAEYAEIVRRLILEED